MLGALFLMIGVIFIVFFAPSLAVLFVGELACGIPWGFYNNVASAYASEVNLRNSRSSIKEADSSILGSTSRFAQHPNHIHSALLVHW